MPTHVRHNPKKGTPKVPKDSILRAPEPKIPSLQTTTQTTPIVDWPTIQQANMVNKLGQSTSSLPGDREIDMGWDPTTPT
jgi:hypothetical protein